MALQQREKKGQSIHVRSSWRRGRRQHVAAGYSCSLSLARALSLLAASAVCPTQPRTAKRQQQREICKRTHLKPAPLPAMNLAVLGVPLAIADSKEVMVEILARGKDERTSVRWIEPWSEKSQPVRQGVRGHTSTLHGYFLRHPSARTNPKQENLADLFPVCAHAVPLHTPCFQSSQGISRTAMTLDEKGRRLHGRLEFFDRNVAQLIRHIGQTVGHHQGASFRSKYNHIRLAGDEHAVKKELNPQADKRSMCYAARMLFKQTVSNTGSASAPRSRPSPHRSRSQIFRTGWWALPRSPRGYLWREKTSW